MNLLDFFSFKRETKVPETITSETKHQAFSTPFLKIGKGNLGQPFVSPHYTVSGIVQFGSDNLYPQILDQMYYTSAIHGACIDFIANAAVGGGYTFTVEPTTAAEKIECYAVEKKYKLKKLVRELTRDFIIHKRVTVIVCRNTAGKVVKLKRLNPATIRNSQDCQKFVYCNDWSRRSNLVEYKRYSPDSKDIESLFVYQNESVGQDIYPLPTYISILNDAFLDGEIAFLQKSNIQNSIWPSIAVRVPKTLDSQEERDAFKDGLSSKTGAGNAGKVVVLTGNGFDDTPEIVSLNTNQNDKLFDSTLDSIMNKICIAHGINPSIMGIKVAGSLGNAQELQMSYGIFEKNIVMPLRNELEEIFDEILDVIGYHNSVQITDFQIIDNSVKEVPSLEDKIKEAAISAVTPKA